MWYLVLTVLMSSEHEPEGEKDMVMIKLDTWLNRCVDVEKY